MEEFFITKIRIDKVRHLKDLDINLGDSKKHLIITGKNGSGKTSLLEGLKKELKDKVNKNPLEDDTNKSELYKNLSLTYKSSGDLIKALEFQLKAINIDEKILNENNPDLATSYNNLSTIYQSLGNLDKALDFQIKAISINEKVLDKNHPNLAGSYNNISTIYRDLGKLNKALDFQIKAISINEKVLDKNYPNLATSYSNLSTIYESLGEFDKALDFQIKAINIDKKILKENNPNLATSYSNLSTIYQSLGNLDKALDFQIKAIQIREKTLDKNHPNLASSYNNISMIYQSLGNLDKALEFQLKAISINEKALDKNHPNLATSYSNLSTIYQSLGNLDKALDFQIKAISINEKVLDKNHPNLAGSYNNLSTIYKDLRELNKALDFGLKSLNIIEKILPKNHPNLATSYNNLSMIYKDLGELNKALDFGLKSLNIMEKALPKNHPNLATLYKNLSTIYKKLGNSGMYDYYHKKFIQIRKKINENINELPKLDNEFESIKIENLDNFDTSELPKLDDEEQKNLENSTEIFRLDIDFNNDSSIYKDFKNGEFITAFFSAKRDKEDFSAKRDTKFKEPKGANSDINFKPYYNVEDNIGKDFTQYIVNLRVDKSFDKEDNDNESVNKIDEWFNTFESSLCEIFESKIKLEFDRKNYNFNIIEEGKELYNLNQLSDGYSAILNIVTELMMRMEEHKTIGYDIQGVVLIDEIETHLHIELQKKILPFLTKFFPQIQFIVTTHSPFILSSLENAVSYDLEKKEEITNLSAYSYDTLVEDYFDSDKFSNVLKEKIQKYEKLIELKDLSDRQKYEKEILQEYFDNIPKFFISNELALKLKQLELKDLDKE